MARTTAEALDRMRDLLIHPEAGVNAQIAGIEARDSVILPRVAEDQFVLMNLPPDLADQSLDVTYPALYLFVEEAQNTNSEKFAYFSGSLLLGIDVRVTAEDPEELESALHRYVEAVLNVLQVSRGEWSAGLSFSGRYAVRFSVTRMGGDNFIQSARLSLPLDQYVSL